MRGPAVIYFDFEAILEKLEPRDKGLRHSEYIDRGVSIVVITTFD